MRNKKKLKYLDDADKVGVDVKAFIKVLKAKKKDK